MNGQQVSYHRLVLAIDRFSDALMENLERFIQIEDSSGVETIWTCCIACLGHLAALCHFISHTVLALRDSMDGLCDLTLEKLVSLSHEVYIEEYSYFDVLTGVCVWICPGQVNANQHCYLDLLEEGPGHD